MGYDIHFKMKLVVKVESKIKKLKEENERMKKIISLAFISNT